MNPPAYFKDTYKELNQRYFIIISEIVKTYPPYKVVPKFNNYKADYEHNIENLQQLQEEIFLFKNKLSKATDTLQEDIKQIDDTLYTIEEELKKLREEFAYLSNSDNAAHGQLVDSKTLYNQQLTGNWLFFFIITGLGYTLFKSTTF